MITRIEYKYFVPVQLKSQVLLDIQKFTALDPYSNNPLESYRVVSLYFEGRELKSYFDKIEGHAKKFKVRLRYYPDFGDTEKANLEIKYKLFDKCYKEKIAINVSYLLGLETNSFAGLGEGQLDPTLENFLDLKKRHNLVPFIRVDYRRKALFSFSDKNLRITYDSEINCIRFKGQDSWNANIPVIPRELGVLEIKSPGYFPWWLSRIIKKYSLSRSAISKYGYGVQSLAMNSTLNFA